MLVINASSVDPDQTLRFAASDLDLHCLPMSLLQDARHKWVKDWHLKKVREKSRECHNHKPQPFPDTRIHFVLHFLQLIFKVVVQINYSYSGTVIGILLH